jgi:hypothetical protein
MKPFFNNTTNTTAVQEPELLNLLFHEIKNNRLGFPSKNLQKAIERSVSIRIKN